jgi:hypothetical protein
MWYKVLLIVLLLGVGTAETIKQTCEKCSAGTCIIYDGGPFNRDSIPAPCTSADQGTIDIGCSCSLGCGYSISASGNTFSGCATSSDAIWSALEINLNAAYKYFGHGDSYDWCGGVCVGPIIGVVVGVLAGVGIIVGVIIYMRRRKAARQQNGLMAVNTNTNY